MSEEGDIRARLVEAMARSCAKRGYVDTSLTRLLEATGASRAEFDRLFGSKEACAVAAMDEILAEGIAAVGSSFSGDTSEAESTLRALLALLQLFVAKPHMGSLAMTDSRQRLPRAAFERYASGFVILIAMLDRLRADGAEGSQAPPSAARAALGGAEAVIRREIALGRTAALPLLLPDLIYSAVVPFLGQREALRIVRQARSMLVDTGWP